MRVRVREGERYVEDPYKVPELYIVYRLGPSLPQSSLRAQVHIYIYILIYIYIERDRGTWDEIAGCIRTSTDQPPELHACELQL